MLILLLLTGQTIATTLNRHPKLNNHDKVFTLLLRPTQPGALCWYLSTPHALYVHVISETIMINIILLMR